MGIVALVGDATTTTAVALAAAWSAEDEVIVLEFDPSGGSLAAWMDTPAVPSLSTFVANRSASMIDDGSPTWRDVESIIHGSSSGLRFIAAPARSREAARSIGEASISLLPVLTTSSPTVLADAGRTRASDGIPPVLTRATDIVVVHRQDPASPGAASVRLERLVESTEQLGVLAGLLHLAVIGDDPFDVDEIAAYVADHALVTIESATAIAVDPLSAMVLAGRTGVSAKRLSRLPLLRSIAPLADRLSLTAPRAATAPRARGSDADVTETTGVRNSIDPTGALGRVTDRVAARLIDAVERDDVDVRPAGREPLGRDHRRQQLLVGAWIGDEIAELNEGRLREGQRPLDQQDELRLRAGVVAELTGSGPLQEFLSDRDRARRSTSTAISPRGSPTPMGARSTSGSCGRAPPT